VLSEKGCELKLAHLEEHIEPEATCDLLLGFGGLNLSENADELIVGCDSGDEPLEEDGFLACCDEVLDGNVTLDSELFPFFGVGYVLVTLLNLVLPDSLRCLLQLFLSFNRLNC